MWLGDLNGDGREELLLFYDGHSAQVYAQIENSDAAWRYAGEVQVSAPGIDLAELDQAQVQTSEWKDLRIRGLRLRVTPKR